MHPSDRIATLLVRREDPSDIRLRDLYVRVDELPERTLRFGEQFSMELPSGKHKIRATNRLFSETKDFEVTGGDFVEFEAINIWIKGPLALLFVVSGTGAYRVRLRRIR